MLLKACYCLLTKAKADYSMLQKRTGHELMQNIQIRTLNKNKINMMIISYAVCSNNVHLFFSLLSIKFRLVLPSPFYILVANLQCIYSSKYFEINFIKVQEFIWNEVSIGNWQLCLYKTITLKFERTLLKNVTNYHLMEYLND